MTQCYFCGTVQRPLTKVAIYIPANEARIVAHVCNEPACQSRLADRQRRSKEV